MLKTLSWFFKDLRFQLTVLIKMDSLFETGNTILNDMKIFKIQKHLKSRRIMELTSHDDKPTPMNMAMGQNPGTVPGVPWTPSHSWFFFDVNEPLKLVINDNNRFWPIPDIWINFTDLTSRPNPGIMVSKGNYPDSWPYFRLVNYYTLPRCMVI